MWFEPSMPGVPVILPVTWLGGATGWSTWTIPNYDRRNYWRQHPDTRDQFDVAFGDLWRVVTASALAQRGWPSGTVGGVPCLWVPPSTPAFRVQPAGLARALHPYSADPQDARWYVVLGGASAALWQENGASDVAYRELVRQTIGEVAAMAGVRQILFDWECLLPEYAGTELFPKRHPVYSTDKTPGRNFTPSCFAVSTDRIPLDPDAAWTLG